MIAFRNQAEVMNEVYRNVQGETNLKKLRRNFNGVQILPAYYTSGQYVIRITSKNDLNMEIVSRILEKRLTEFCSRRSVSLKVEYGSKVEGNRFTREFTISPHFTV